MCLPHAIVVGAQKAGTTALFGYFLLHQNFEAPYRKELQYFNLVKVPVGGRDEQAGR